MPQIDLLHSGGILAVDSQIAGETRLPASSSASLPAQPKPRSASARLAVDYLRRKVGQIIPAIACMLIVAGTTSVTAWLLNPALEEIFINKRQDMLILLPLAVIGVNAVKAAAAYGQGILIADISRWLASELQTSLFSRLISADLARLKDGHSGTYQTHFLQNANLVAANTANCLVGIFREIPTALGLIVVMFFMEWRLTLAALTVAPMIAALTSHLSRVGKRSMAGNIETSNRLAKQISEALAGIRIVRAYGQEKAEMDRATGLISERMRLLFKAQRASLAAAPMTEALGALGIGIVIYVGGQFVLADTMTLAQFVTFLAALLMMFQPIRGLSNLATVWAQGISAAEKIFEELDTEPKIIDAPDASPLRLNAPGGAEVRFDSVGFDYNDNAPALSGVSLVAKRGETIALVGPSGAGKSTVLNLILRFYDVNRGQISVDGYNIDDCLIASVRDKIALVTQESVLFDDTVAANIAYGVPGASQADIEQAAKLASADEFISTLPNGYQTRVGEDGGLLSGGQRQRIAIARAFLKDAPILLLDEATSALDTASEQRVQQALAELMSGRTTIVIAHRLSTILNADRIYAMDAGRVVEEGTHTTLLQKGGLYASLYNSQTNDRAATPEAAPQEV